MTIRNLFLALAVSGVVALQATESQALQVRVSINFGPTITGPDDGTLIVTAIPGDLLRITWALGADAIIEYYNGHISGVDTAELSRVGGSALELTGQGFSPANNPNAPGGEVQYGAASDGAPRGVAAGNGGELWRIDYTVTNPVTDAATDMTYTFESLTCVSSEPPGACPGTSVTDAVSASLRVNSVPEPGSILLLGSGLAGIAGFRRKSARSSLTRKFTREGRRPTSR